MEWGQMAAAAAAAARGRGARSAGRRRNHAARHRIALGSELLVRQWGMTATCRSFEQHAGRSL